MRGFAILWLKEEKALFSSPIAYVLITVFLLIMGYSFTLMLFIGHLGSLMHLFYQMFVLFLLTVPIITMRLIAEERKLGTIELLLASPATEAQIVLAKFAASMSLLLLMLALSVAYAVVLAIYGILIGGRSSAAISASCFSEQRWSDWVCSHRRSPPIKLSQRCCH